MRALGFLVLFICFQALAHQSSITSSQKEIRWNYTNIPVKVVNNSSFATANSLISQSIAEWNAASNFQLLQVTTSNNQIKFSSDPTLFGSAVVGVTEVNYNTSGVINAATIYLNEPQIAETRGTGRVYLKDVVTHELGHLAGLAHSEVLNSSMFYLSHPGQGDLSADDKAAIRAKYETSYGKIYGYVKGGSHIGVLGVHVQALSRKTGEIVSAVSDEDGYFSINGLSLNDTYYLYTSSLKNLNALPSFYANVQSEFCPSSYVGSFFSACGKDHDGIPQGINLTSAVKAVDVGVVSINCTLRTQEEYTYEKVQTGFNQITIFDFGEEQRYEKSFVGFFRKDQLSTSTWTTADKFRIDLTDLNPNGRSIRFRLISQPFGNSIEYAVSLYRNGYLYGTYLKNLVVPENTLKLDLEIADALNTNAADNIYELEIRAKQLNDAQAAISIPDISRFGTDQNLPYLLSMSLEDLSGPILTNTSVNLSDNASCLDAPFTYAVKKTTGFSDDNSTTGSQQAAAAATCGTIEPPSGPGNGPGQFMLILSLGFMLSLLASELVKRGKNILS